MSTSKSNSEKNNDQKVDLMSLASDITKTSLKKSSSKKSMNDYLLEVLLDTKLSKDRSVEIIAVKRIEEKFSSDELSKINQEDLLKLMRSEMKTVGNGFDTSVCDGSNNSCFRFNPKYSKYDLTKNDDKTFIITLKK